VTNQPIDITARLDARQKKWHVTVVVHSWPSDDLIDHAIFARGCSCGAEIEESKMADGSPAWLIKHNALDGRE